MFGDPEFFDIEQKKLFGIWPHDQLIGRGILPYLRRMKVDKLAGLVVGDHKGENIYDILSNGPENIVKLNVVHDETMFEDNLRELYRKNTSEFDKKLESGITPNKRRNFVIIDKSMLTVENLEKYYDMLRPNGIFCGNGYDLETTKETLRRFRRKNKIGIPIQISFTSTWFWYKKEFKVEDVK